MSKITVLPKGACARWTGPSLQQLSADPIVLPIVDARRNFESTHKRSRHSSKKRLEHVREHKMTVATAETRKMKRLPTFAERGRRPSKAISHPQHQATTRNNALVPASKTKPRNIALKESTRPDTRKGTSKAEPITIDDDDDDEIAGVGAAAYGPSDFFCSNFQVSSPTPLPNGIYSPLSSSPVPTRDVTQNKRRTGSMRGTYVTPPPRAAHDSMAREPSIYAA
jgi:hypothetical protein